MAVQAHGAYVGLVLAPHYSRMSIGAYKRLLKLDLDPTTKAQIRERIKTLRAIKLNPTALDADTVNDLIRKLYAKFLGV